MRCNFNRRSAHETCVCVCVCAFVCAFVCVCVCVCVCARAKFVPRLLTDDQREQRQTIARGLFERSCEDVKSLKNTATGDESWVYRYDPKTKQQSSQ